MLQRATIVLAIASATMSGCKALPPAAADTDKAQSSHGATPSNTQPRAFYDGRTGEQLDWPLVRTRLLASDIILVGEQHDNVAGHHLEAELADTLLCHTPQAAIALEMFERDEQGLVDLYLDGHIAAPTLVTLTDSANWGGSKNTWMDWYQPLVDHVKNRRTAGAALIAANAPRTYVKLARLEGFEALSLLPPQERTAFALPTPTVDDHAYRERFVALITPHTAHNSVDAEPGSGTTSSRHAMPDRVENYFRAQQVWDATIADSAVLALRHHPKAILIAGEFHLAYDGGTLQRVRHGAPRARITTLSILRSATQGNFDPADIGRADIVIYTR